VESLFKPLKYVPNSQQNGFESLTEARLWVKKFVNWYNNEHRHSGINYVTPSESLVKKEKGNEAG
jgi:putative transposase